MQRKGHPFIQYYESQLEPQAMSTSVHGWRRLVTGILVCALALGLGSCARYPVRTPTAVCNIVGVAYLLISGQSTVPASAKVTATQQTSPSASYSAITDSDGSFVLIVQSGTYLVTATSAQFPDSKSDAVEVTVALNDTASIELLIYVN